MCTAEPLTYTWRILFRVWQLCSSFCGGSVFTLVGREKKIWVKREICNEMKAITVCWHIMAKYNVIVLSGKRRPSSSSFRNVRKLLLVWLEKPLLEIFPELQHWREQEKEEERTQECPVREN